MIEMIQTMETKQTKQTVQTFPQAEQNAYVCWTKTLAQKYECNTRKSIFSPLVLTFCEKYAFNLILQLMFTSIFKAFVSKF